MKTLPILIVASAALFLPNSATALELLGYWNFDNQTEDQSGNGNTATLADGAVISPDAEGFTSTAGDYALELGVSGDSARADINGDFSGATINNAMAVSFWQFDIGDGAGGNASSTAFGFPSSDGGGNRGFQAHTPWGDGNAYFDHGGACCGLPNRLSGPVGTEGLNSWRHIVLQVDNGQKQIWIDGAMFLEQAAGAAPIPAFTGQLMIGAEPAGTNNGFGGRIDEFAVFDDALTGAQIARLFAGEPATDLIDTTDSDGDGLLDVFEQQIIDADPGDAIETVEDVLPGDDFDNDGSTNVEERDAGTDPTNPDSDNDGLEDGVESNSGIFVSADSDTGTNPLNPDSDGDGLSDGVEDPTEPFVDADQPGTDPNNPDSDGDGFDDQFEIVNGSDPTDADDTPFDLELLGYWNFDDNSDPGSSPDLSGNDQTAIFADGASFSPAGDGYSSSGSDRALELGLSGDSARADVTIDLSKPTTNNAMAVSFWQYDIGDGAGANASTTVFGMLSSSGGGTRGFQAHTPWGDGTLYFDHGGACCGGANRLTSIVDTTLLDGWHHIVLQVENGNKQIWVDGTMAAEQAGAAAIPTFTDQLMIGAEPAGTNNGFGGRIDEFAVFNLSLSPEQIADLASGTPANELLEPAAPFVITEISLDEEGRATITFNAKQNRNYAVFVSADMANWTELSDNESSDTGSISYTDNVTPLGAARLFYIAREL
jgi:hypothetical protein